MSRKILTSFFSLFAFFCFSQDETNDYPSQQETDYYKTIKVKEFRPSSISSINGIKYDYLKIKEGDTINRFISVWEKTNYQKYYDSLSNVCVANRNKIKNNRDTIADRKYSECMDSIRDLSYAEKIGHVFYNSILRYDSLDSLKIVLYEDSKLENREVGYWLSISHDKGQSWISYYTGLVQNNFYYIKPNPKIRLIKNVSTIQLEFAIVRKTVQAVLPVGAPEYELIRDYLIMEVDLTKIVSDKDNDGLSDIVEKKLGTNPLDKDSDHDGISDAQDKNPRYKDVMGKYSTLFKYLLESQSYDSVFLPFDNFKFVKQTDDHLELQRTYLIVADNPNLINLTGTKNTYIIMTSKEFEAYKTFNYVTPEVMGVSPAFDINGKPGWKKIHISGGFWGNDYLIIEKSDGWIIKYLGGYII